MDDTKENLTATWNLQFKSKREDYPMKARHVILAAALCLLTLVAVQRRTFATAVPAKEPA